MRSLLIVLGAMSFLLGCSVVDEINDIGKDPKKEAAAKPSAAASDALPAVPEGSNQAKLRAYYNRRAKPTQDDPDNPIVKCRLSGGEQYMRLYDCELRGGRTNI